MQSKSKRKFYHLVLLITALGPLGANAQQKLPSIQLDRPDQTECPFLTPQHYIQVENGFNIERISSGNNAYKFPTSLWKYGINHNVEFRLITELVRTPDATNAVTGINPITVGFKARLLEEKGIVPKTSFIGHVRTAKVGSENFRTTYIAPSFRFVMQHTLSPKLVLAYNLGAEWNGETGQHSYIYTLTTGLSLTDRWGCYAEMYGFLPSGINADHRCDGGFTYLINDNLITDLSGGVGLSANSPDGYISYGLSFRFNTRKNYVQGLK